MLPEDILSDPNFDANRTIAFSGIGDSSSSDANAFEKSVKIFIEQTFSIAGNAVDEVRRIDELGNEGDGCGCIVIFRSNEHKQLVAMQKQKISSPIKIDTFDKIVDKSFENNAETAIKAEIASGNIPENSGEMAEETDQSLGQNEDEYMDTDEDDMDSSGNAHLKSSDKNLQEHVADANEKSAKQTETAEDVQPDNAASFIQPCLKDEIESSNPIADVERYVNEPTESDKFNENSEMRPNCDSDTQCKEQDDDSGLYTKKGLMKLDAHCEHYLNLPISWRGAPIFHWRRVKDLHDRRMVIIANALPADLHNPWLYTVILRARLIRTNFPQIFAQESVTESHGRIELFFSDDTAIISCALNFLVHLRTKRNRRLKIFIPHTDFTIQCKSELEKRFGRMREFPQAMRQLLFKLVPENITEESIRKAFENDFEVDDVTFKMDMLNQRCAVVTFATVARAIAAHCSNDYFELMCSNGVKIWMKALYVCAAIRDWAICESLLTRGEYKTYRSQLIKNKKDDDESEKDEKSAIAPEAEQISIKKESEDKANMKKFDGHIKKRRRRPRPTLSMGGYPISARPPMPHFSEPTAAVKRKSDLRALKNFPEYKRWNVGSFSPVMRDVRYDARRGRSQRFRERGSGMTPGRETGPDVNYADSSPYVHQQTPFKLFNYHAASTLNDSPRMDRLLPPLIHEGNDRQHSSMEQPRGAQRSDDGVKNEAFKRPLLAYQNPNVSSFGFLNQPEHSSNVYFPPYQPRFGFSSRNNFNPHWR